ncbi:MAG: cation acetate symporter [Tistrella sp.]|jgi:cation/acetate symporter|uniref:Cation acetate symporter n=1 Tax=Tistrella mobilis TaxID=171437 RepID=A0A3B9IKA8_9PROT|nr:sodium:solute symporter family protein [Tistrella sp.]MAD40640.1 cation acetate symporter [Tistrella sp.]MBA78885.1 cation acetate symporter [Tistrella sp.]HAE48291.1 cation acetate symporter [Tistrella mobilis]
MKGDFTQNLGKVYGIYTGSFVGFTILLAILEQMGVPDRIIGYAFVAVTIGVYAMIGILSRTVQVSEYYVAGRRVPALYNGMATAADWMSAASFIGMAGTLYASGYNGLAFVLGWTGGYVLVAVLLAPYLRKFGQFTVPDFLGTRYDGHAPRLIGIAVLMMCSFTYVVAQVTGAGIIASRFLAIPFEIGIFVGLVGILVCSMLGGMRAVTWTQVAQYIILIIAYLIPIILMSAQLTGVPVPQIMYGYALQEIEQIEPTLGVAVGHVTAFARDGDMLNFFSLVLCLMVGTAALPHVLMRFFTTPSVREARSSVGWSLLFIFLLYFSAPAYAAFAKLEVYTNVIGQPIASLPDWVRIWSDIGLLAIRDANGDGLLQLAEFTINNDAIVLATPEIAGLPYVIAGLVSAGGLAAALSTADGLLLAIANALSHDIYYKMIDPKASAARRLIVARVLLILVAMLAAYVASFRPAGILAMVAWAFSIAASGLFPALVMGVWWKRTTKAGACAGMLAGLAVCLIYLAGTQWYGMELWFGVRNISAGLFGIPAGFLVTWAVSLMTREPSKDMQDFIEFVRVPSARLAENNPYAQGLKN